MVVVRKGRKRLFTGFFKPIYTAIVFSLASQFNLLHRFQLRLGDKPVKSASLASAVTGVKIWIGLTRSVDFVDAKPPNPLTSKGRYDSVMAFEIMSIRDYFTTDILNPDYNTRTK